MQIRIRERDVEVTESLRVHVERRLGIALGRFGDRIRCVTVRLSSAGIDAGGRVNRCQIDVGLRPIKVQAGDVDADLFAAVDNASNRVSRSVARALQLERERGVA